MSESKPNRVSIKIPEGLHHEIDIASATRKLPIYVLIEQAWRQFVSSESAIPSGTKVGNPPPTVHDPHVGLDFPRESTRMESPRPFITKLVAMLNSVPQESVPVVEECLLQIVKLASGQLAGVKTDEQGAPNRQRHFKKVNKLRDNAGDVEDVSGQSA